MCQPLAFPHCHVLFWMRREFNSCDDVVHSTHLDYPLSPLHSIISFFSTLCACIRQCVCVNRVSHPGLPQLFFYYLFRSKFRQMNVSCLRAPLNCRTNPRWRQNSSLTSAALFFFKCNLLVRLFGELITRVEAKVLKSLQGRRHCLFDEYNNLTVYRRENKTLFCVNTVEMDGIFAAK